MSAPLRLFGQSKERAPAVSGAIRMPKDLPPTKEHAPGGGGAGGAGGSGAGGGGSAHAQDTTNSKIVMPKDLPPTKETNGASASPGTQRAGVRRESAPTRGRIREADGGVVAGASKPRRYKSILIQEGLGNFRDGFYYTAQALESAPAVFEGAKCYIDHPSESEEHDRPERSVREVCGHYEGVHVEQSDDGRSLLVGDLVLLDGPPGDHADYLAQGALSYALKYPGKELIGLSINADGESGQVGLESFIQENQIPASCQSKLAEAAAKGLTVVRPVVQFTSAVSCDLVTSAGAGGKIAQLLEQERSMAKKEGKEESKKEEGKKEAGDAPAPDKKDAPAAGGDGAGKDGDAGGDGSGDPQDADLIKKMLNKYLGDGHDEETMKLAHEAYQNSLEMGMDHEEAMKCAGYNMKMAKHLQKKEKGAAGGDHPEQGASSGGVPDQTSKPGTEESKHEAGAQPGAQPAPGATQESAKVLAGKLREAEAKVLKLTGENVALREKVSGYERDAFVDKTLRESKLPRAATHKFRECIKDCKSEKEITERLSIFKEALKLGGEADGGGFILGAEKQTQHAGGAKLSFSDCVEE